MKKIKLTQGKYALVDNEDFEKLSQFKWHAVADRRISGGQFYACRSVTNKPKIKMHRVIMSCPDGLEVDHKDHNGLNNQKKNLRIVDRLQNQRNQKPQVGGTSKYKGVHFNKRIKKKPWVARISVKNKPISLGNYATPEEAALAYNAGSLKYHGEHGYQNKVKQV